MKKPAFSLAILMLCAAISATAAPASQPDHASQATLQSPTTLVNATPAGPGAEAAEAELFGPTTEAQPKTCMCLLVCYAESDYCMSQCPPGINPCTRACGAEQRACARDCLTDPLSSGC